MVEQIQIEINQTEFKTNIVIPKVPTGSYTLTAENINITTIATTFQVTPQPTITFIPDSAVPGTPITITGSGFPKSTTTETYNIELRGNYISNSLWNALLLWFKGKADLIEIGAQISNYPVQQALSQTGFRIVKAKCTFHWSKFPDPN